MNVLYGDSSACSGIFRLNVAEPAHKRILSAAQHQIKTLAFLLVTRSLTIQESIIAKVRPASRQTITNVTHTLQAPRPGSPHPELPTTEGVQGPIFLGGTR